MRAVALLAASLAVLASPDATAGGQADKLEGDWTEVEAVAYGVKAPKGKFTKGVRFKGGKMALLWDGKPMKIEYAYKVDDSKTPATITTTQIVSGKPAGGAKSVMIYRITGGRLQTCWDNGGGTPKEFASEKKSLQSLHTYERAR